jgi:hypothetical protein
VSGSSYFDQSSVNRFAGQRFEDIAGLPSWMTGLGNTLRSGLKTIRDQAVVPTIDAGLQSGLLNPQVGMFGRYLTGTNKPLTNLPPSVNAAINQQMPAYQRDAVDWRGPTNFDVRQRMGPRGEEGTAYQPWVPKDLQNTLGQFVVRPNQQGQPTVSDRYQFDTLRDATEGGKTAQNIIKMAQQLGVINPDFSSGYDIRAPIR